MEDDGRTYVQWDRADGYGRTAWHISVPVANDTDGRTQCGTTFPRRTATFVPRSGVSGHLCVNCDVAVRNDPSEQEA